MIRRRPLVMAVLNATPDSFSDGGKWFRARDAVRRAREMTAAGADLVDIGGESTRPGAAPVSLAEELRRVVPVIERLASSVRIPISVDTSKAEVAARAIAAGASIVNDVTALHGDPQMASMVADSRAAVILMHMRGSPDTMQRSPRYRDVASEVERFLLDATATAQRSGIERSRILIDPGLGFGKTVTHNLQLMHALPRLASLGFPVVIGPSRKSFIGRVLNAEISDRLYGTLACVAQAFYGGAHLVRVHDVKPAADLLRMLEAIEKAGNDAVGRQH